MDEEPKKMQKKSPGQNLSLTLPTGTRTRTHLSAMKNWKKLWQKNGTLLWKVSWSRTSIL